jgi:predicted dithiol-disulfide oxidoreductase (DUF899 family)
MQGATRSTPISRSEHDDDDRVHETYWATDRGNEAGFWSYGLLDRTVFGRPEPCEDSPDGWPALSCRSAGKPGGAGRSA